MVSTAFIVEIHVHYNAAYHRLSNSSIKKYQKIKLLCSPPNAHTVFKIIRHMFVLYKSLVFETISNVVKRHVISSVYMYIYSRMPPACDRRCNILIKFCSVQ